MLSVAHPVHQDVNDGKWEKEMGLHECSAYFHLNFPINLKLLKKKRTLLTHSNKKEVGEMSI